MLTQPACLPCFSRQISQAARLVAHTAELQNRISNAAEMLLADLDMQLSPPENAVPIYELIARLAENSDPFAALKTASTGQALRLRPQAAAIIKNSVDPIATALRFAIAGNIMDYGALEKFDIDRSLAGCLNGLPAIDDSANLIADLAKAETVLYLADNCGELVFDGLLIETMGREVTVAVKERPVINDATLEDAAISGLPNCRVITNGTGCPGTPLASCSASFRAAFARADLIISKGQGNFETLSEVEAPIYFLLTVKCATVAEHLKEKTGNKVPALGDLVVLRNR